MWFIYFLYPFNVIFLPLVFHCYFAYFTWLLPLHSLASFLPAFCILPLHISILLRERNNLTLWSMNRGEKKERQLEGAVRDTTIWGEKQRSLVSCFEVSQVVLARPSGGRVALWQGRALGNAEGKLKGRSWACSLFFRLDFLTLTSGRVNECKLLITFERLYGEILSLTVWGMHVNHAVQRGICLPT